MRILIVEDEPIIALSTQADLEAAGHTVVGLAMTSDEAINLAASCHPDLVLMDIRLAEGNGVEAAQAIHTAGPFPRCSPRAMSSTREPPAMPLSLLEEAIRLSEPYTKHPDRRAGDERA